MNAMAAGLPTEQELRATIRDFDPALDEGSDEFNAALVMWAALYTGTGHGACRKISALTRVPYHRVCEFGRRLKEAGIWDKGKTFIDGWDDDKFGQLSFWLDVGVATGRFTRVSPHGLENEKLAQLGIKPKPDAVEQFVADWNGGEDQQ